MKREVYLGLLLAVLGASLACSLWFRGDKVDAGFTTDDDPDSVAMRPPVVLEDPSFERQDPDPFLLEEIPEEDQNEPEGGN